MVVRAWMLLHLFPDGRRVKSLWDHPQCSWVCRCSVWCICSFDLYFPGVYLPGGGWWQWHHPWSGVQCKGSSEGGSSILMCHDNGWDLWWDDIHFRDDTVDFFATGTMIMVMQHVWNSSAAEGNGEDVHEEIQLLVLHILCTHHHECSVG